MFTILKQLPIVAEADLLVVHNLALQMCERAGLSIGEQLHFACRTTELCSKKSSWPDEITFSIDTGDHRRILRAATRNHPGPVFIETPYQAGDPREEIVLYKEGSYRDMEQFNLALCHELKNSIAKIKLAVSLLELEEMTEPVNNYAKIIHRASARLEQTMLNLNEIIRLRHVLDLAKSVSPAKVFKEVKEYFADALTTAIINADFNDTPEINYIEPYLQIIFSNIVSNAIKYADDSRFLHFTVSTRREADQVVFTFTDNGRGIDLAVAGAKLFHPFSRFTNHREGSGLGLYLVKNIVERNGGRVEVDSTPGQGSVFRFFLREY